MLSLLLIYLDSYEISFIPLTWIGNALLFSVFLFIAFNEKIIFDQITIIIFLVALMPTFISMFFLDFEISYLVIRFFSIFAFAIILNVLIRLNQKISFYSILKKIYFMIATFSLYLFTAQIFNLYEPLRNRPGTGILGFDAQTNFWIYGSHRLVGTFREPIFFVSLVFPAFLVLHFKKGNSYLFYILSGAIFGLTKSELALIFVLALLFLDLLMKNFNKKTIVFVTVFISTFFVTLTECEISPSNIECPNEEIEFITSESEIFIEDPDITISQSSEQNNKINSSTLMNSILSVVQDINFQDRERSDIFLFTDEYYKNNTGFGLQNTNRVYTDYLSLDVLHEQYLTNRTLPEYLNIKFLSKSFGTGRYFLTYENVNIQNNFLFNYFSLGPIYPIFILLAIVRIFFADFKKGLQASLLIFVISFSSFEDLLPVFGFYLGLMFTMEKYENK